MDCPSCGLPAVPDQKFCRACGRSLRLTTQRLPEPVSLSADEDSSARYYAAPRRAHNLMLAGFISILTGAALGVIGKKLMHNELVAVIGILISLFGMFLTVYPHLMPPRRQKQKSAPPSQPEQFTQSEPARALPHERTVDYVASITERTTDLLKNAPPSPEPKADRESGG